MAKVSPLQSNPNRFAAIQAADLDAGEQTTVVALAIEVLESRRAHLMPMQDP